MLRLRSSLVPPLLAVALLPAAACSGSRGSAGGSPEGPPDAAAVGRLPNAKLPPAVTDPRLPRTRAEQTSYRETSRHADVVAFIDSLRRLGAPITVGSIGTSTEGRTIPYVVASRPPVSTPADARASGRPVVYVQGNIHAGEVEGKEALQALVRDLVFASSPNVLDSIVLVAVPIYNTDGNDRFDAQERNRGSQNGPEQIGRRANGQGLDLNRDYIKADAPETRASLAMFAQWDPDVFVDLHTTNGSYHGYALTYAPSLNPAADLPPAFVGGGWARDSLLPELRRRVRTRRGYETFDYGNFVSNDSVERGWFTYDHRPRFGTNYQGLRGRIAVLSEAYSHDPFERRVASTYAFVSELLSLVAERGGRIRSMSRAADSAVMAWGSGSANVQIPIRAELTTPAYTGDVIVERLETTGDSTRTEPGVPRGRRRTGEFRRVRIPVYDRFTTTLRTAQPWGYAFEGSDTAAVRLLRLHGIAVERVSAPCAVPAESFAVDSATFARQPFQNRREVRIEGRWERAEARLRVGTYVIRTAQPLGVLATYLVDPRSDDGLVTWNVGDRVTPNGALPATVRLPSPLPGGCSLASAP